MAKIIDGTTAYNNSTGQYLRGLSAYQIWLTQNNRGSVKDFLESLKGESVELRQNGTTLEWKYTNEEDWHVFVDIDSIIEDSVTDKVTEQLAQQVQPIVQEQMSQYAPTQVQNSLPDQGDPGVFYIIRGEEGGDG